MLLAVSYHPPGRVAHASDPSTHIPGGRRRRISELEADLVRGMGIRGREGAHVKLLDFLGDLWLSAVNLTGVWSPPLSFPIFSSSWLPM